ncbi:GDP-mannose mannosyl hydrolase [Thalassotalea euphylliae]|uniref:GDP-mannose mannosyl hydrolase n=1 Tax=Thalassotalea euphylliae TaxID=1655234 RepID=A0A3E0U0D2_9GAMM|nr:GDP-mannose mannosyl hydrolase [Thalassotalea euphylliae]REL30184.1 GDP-mannose mannosyl hydrolase [Thalassotalea euphylliae]
MLLPNKDFKFVVESTPLISIDLVVKNLEGNVLLGLRHNRPAKGYWFVPGGRILKNEPLEVAFTRLVKEELNHDMQMEDAKFWGVFQHFYDDSVFNDEVTTHYVVLAYEMVLDIDIPSLPKQQHSKYKWFTSAEILKCDMVHEHTKWYFVNKTLE